MKFIITQHAIEQYIRRWAKQSSVEQARSEIISLLETSKCVTNSNKFGGNIFVSGHRPDIRFIIKDRNTCVTVLPNNDKIDLINQEIEDIREKSMEMAIIIADAMDISIKDEKNIMTASLNKMTSRVEEIDSSIVNIELKRENLAKEKSSLHNEKTRLHNQISKIQLHMKKFN